MEICTAEGKRWQETVLSALGPYLGTRHHFYQDKYYNATSTAESLLQRKVESVLRTGEVCAKFENENTKNEER